MRSSALAGAAPLQIAQGLIGLCAIAAFTRLMTPDQFGLYALVLSLSMLAHTLCFTWAEAAAYRFYAVAAAENRLDAHFASLRRLCAIAGAVFLAAAGIAALAVDDKRLAALILFAAPAAVLRFYVRVTRETERAALMPVRMAAMETAYVSLGLAAGIGLLMTLDLGAAAPFAGLALAGALVLALDLARTKTTQPAPPSARGDGMAAYARYGAPLAAALAIDLGVQALARLILADSAGLVSLGAYAAAFGLARPLDMIFLWAAATLIPAIMAAYERHGREAARDAAARAFTLMAAAAAPAALGLMLIAQPLAALVVGTELAAGAARALPWLAATALIGGFNLYYWSEAFQLTRRTGLRALVMLVPGAAQLALTLVLAPRYGAAGAGAAALAAAMLGAVLLCRVGGRLLSLPLPLKNLLRIGAACAAMAATVLAMPPAQSWLQLCFTIFAAAGAYALCAFLFDLGGVRGPISVLSQALIRKLRAPLQFLFTDRADGRAG